MACSKNTWSKIIAILTSILSFAYVLLLALIVVYYNSPNIFSFWDILFYIGLYLAQNDPQSTIVLYCAIVLNTCWIITSIILSILLFKTDNNDFSIKRTQKLLNVQITWIVFGLLSIIPDIVSILIAGIYYAGQNIIATNGPLYMLLISSRFVIVLVFHIVSWIFMIFMTSALQKSIVEDGTKPVGRTVPLKPPKPVLKPSKVPTLEDTNADRVRDWYSHYEGEKQLNNNHEPGYIPRIDGIVNPAYMNGNHYVSRPTSPEVQSPGYHIPGSKTNVMVNGVTSGTLRKQLPWSYVPGGKELSQQHSKMHQPTPYVPAPDYDYNRNKNQRRELNQPRWSQYM